MKISMILFLMAMILSWVTAQTSQPASTNQQEKNKSSSSEASFQSTQGNEGTAKRKEEEEEAYKSRVSRVGSRPPSCKYKCQGCNPCRPIQIPTISTTLTLHLQFANYEPEGWKCTCGSSFFNP